MALLDQINKLTLGEIAQVEEIGKGSLSEFADESKPKARLLIALAYILKRRQDPSFTVSQAEALTMEDLTEITGGEDDPEPSSA